RRGVAYRGVVGGVAEAEERQRLERSVENYRPGGCTAACCNIHYAETVLIRDWEQALRPSGYRRHAE
ncbi:MAG: hypothetical protein ABIP09_00745, partial [Gemmatimonadaceae bacterium]